MSRNICNEGEQGYKEAYTNLEDLKIPKESNYKSIVEKFEQKVQGTAKKRSVNFGQFLARKFHYKKTPITEKDLQKVGKQLFGTDIEGRKMMEIFKIGNVLNSQPHLQEAFYYEANRIANKYIEGLEGDSNFILGRTEILNVPIPDLHKFPYGAIIEFSSMLNDFYLDKEKGADLDIKKGYFGNLQLEFTLTRKMTRKTTNPYFINYIRSIIKKPSDEQAFNRKYMVPSDTFDNRGRLNFKPNNKDVYRIDKDDKGKIIYDDTALIPNAKKGEPIKYDRKSHGINDMYNRVIPISFKNYFGTALADKTELMELLHRYQQGKVFFDKKGMAWHYTTWGKVKGKGGKQLFYEDNPSKPIYRWMNPIPYVLNKKKEFVNYNPSEMDTKLVKEKDDKGNTINEKWVFGKNNKPLILDKKVRVNESQFGEFHELVNGFQSILRAFGVQVKAEKEKQTKRKLKIYETAKQNMDDERFEEFKNELGIIFEGDQSELHGLDEFHLNRKMYFPIKYTHARLLFGLDKALDQLEMKQIKNNELLQTSKIQKNPLKFKQLREESINNQNTIDYVIQMKDMLASDDLATDGSAQKNPIFIQTYLKNFKTASHIIDKMQSRLDELILHDYVEDTAKGLQRNEVGLNLMELIANSPNEPKTIDYAMNLLKITYQFPDAIGSVLGIKHTDAGMKKLFNRISPDINQLFRNYSSFNAGSLLMSPTDGLINLISSIQDVIESGSQSFLDAYSDYQSATKYWEELAENKGGVVTFQKYLENVVDRFLRVSEIEEGYFLRDEYKNEYKKMLKDINTLNPEEISSGAKKHIKRVQASIKILDNKMPTKIQKGLQEFAKYAVTHKLEFSRYQKDSKGTWKSLANVYQVFPSIALTEKQLRVVSFIVGYKKAEKYFKGTNATQDDIIDHAKEYVFQAQFALETNLAGLKGGTSASKLWYNITFFQTQKTGWELDVHKGWFSQFRNPAYLLMQKQKEKALRSTAKNFDKNVKAPLKAYSNAIRSLMSIVPGNKSAKKRRDALNTLSPMIGRGNLFFATFGIASAATSLALFSASPVLPMFASLRKWLFANDSWRVVAGLNSKLYSAPITLSVASYYILKSILSDEDEDDDIFYEIQRNTRHVTGVAGSDIVTLGLKSAQILDNAMNDKDKKSKIKFSAETGVASTVTEPVINYTGKAIKSGLELLDDTDINLRYNRYGREY
tara:strand:+ start:150 stop:3743 length:3594 start_codon:yes stop_codon:yes gene_type:complete